MRHLATLTLCLVLASCVRLDSPMEDDPYLWLEEVNGEASLAWVEAQNERSVQSLSSHPLYEALYDEAYSALSSQTRLPAIQARAGYLYNLWQDRDHPRGIYRRTTLNSFRQAEPEWETVLDLDKLSADEGTRWVFRGLQCLEPDYQKCLLRLSPGGSDAVEVREFDMAAMAFVENGFYLPAAKHSLSWIDQNTLYLGTDFDNQSRTDSGYPRKVAVWKRGQAVKDATVIYEGDQRSVSVFGSQITTEQGDINLVGESLDFWRRRYFLHQDSQLLPLNLPDTAGIEGGYQGQLVIYLHSDWEAESQPAGTLLLVSPQYLVTGEGSGPEVLFAADGQRVVEDVSVSKHGIAVNFLENVIGRVLRLERLDGRWLRTRVNYPDNGSISVRTVDGETGAMFAEFESFVEPPTLYYLPKDKDDPEPIKSQTPTFNGSQFEVGQHWVTSDDGTKVPYFVIRSPNLEFDGNNPVHIFAYGGFRNAVTPSYSGSYEALAGAYGKLWLERGGVFVVANIRGGGEFGPLWHRAALRENRPRAFEDFEAVADDLVRRRLTSAGRISIEGRSNGGLLVASSMIRRPDLYGAVVCGVPLADMKRYHKLLAGASWMAEYGNPDVPEDWEFIREYSPYQNLEAGVDYPPIFFFTSTRDDRVHPAHARKMMARMSQQGHEAWYWENLEGGHGGTSTNEQLAQRLALVYTHLWRTVGELR